MATSWDKAAASTPSDATSGTATYTFGDPTTIVHGSVTVTDSNAPNPPLPATVSYTDPSPKTFTYANSVNVPTSSCVFVNNTATFKTNASGTTGSASQKVGTTRRSRISPRVPRAAR